MCSAISPCDEGGAAAARRLRRADGAAELWLAAAPVAAAPSPGRCAATLSHQGRGSVGSPPPLWGREGPTAKPWEGEGSAATPKAPARLTHLYQQSPLRLLFPRPEPGDLFTAALVNTAGGVAGGDRLRVAVTVEAGAAAVVTTQAAEKIYRSLGPDSRIDTLLSVAPGAWLEWAPQEAILFDGARLRRSVEIDLAPGGRLLAGEILVYGRTARGERFSHGLLHENWRVRRAGRLIWADALRLEGDIPAILDAPAGFAGAAASATMLYVADDASQHLDAARQFIALCTAEAGGGRAGATLVGGVLLARFLGPDSQALRRLVAGVWGRFRAAAAGLPARLPRLWHV